MEIDQSNCRVLNASLPELVGWYILSVC